MRGFIPLVFLVFSFSIVFAQTGTIRGVVKDKVSNEPIIGANVSIQGTTLGASTDLDGLFVISKVTPGTYTVVISSIGYRTLTIPNVPVEAGKAAIIDTKIEEDVTSLQEAVVTAQRETNTVISLVKEIKLADQIVVGISAEQISQSQDRDAAQVVKRVPGVTIVNNSFIVVRGLASRYNAVMLHNAYAPSMETDVRSFAFDIIPSSQLDRVLIFQSPSADLPGDFAGGVVKVFTKSIPEENSIVLDYTTSFRTGTTFQDFYYQQRGKNHWLGFNNGFYDLPSSFPADLRRVQGEGLVEAGRSLKNLWAQEREIVIPDQRVALTFNRFFQGKGELKIGNITSINYSNTRSIFSIERGDYNEYDFINDKSFPIYNFFDEQYSQNIRVGILHNWAFKINDRHSIEFKNLYNQISAPQYVYRTGQHFESNYFPRNHSFDQVYRGIYSGQLLGQHEFKSETIKLDWVLGYNHSYRDQPDYKRYRSDFDESSNTTTLFVPSGAAAAEFLGRFFSKMRETAITGGFDLTKKLRFNKGAYEMEAKVGVFYENKERNFNARNIGYNRANTINFDIALLDGTITNLFSPENINNTTGIRIDEQSNPNDNYTSSNRLMAFYGMLSIPLSDRLKIIAGGRYEDNVQKLNSATITNIPVRVNNPVARLLPSANLTYSFSEKMQLRAAYGVTLNRPEFRELAPFGFYDFNLNFTLKGNEGLKTASTQNFDLRWEWYPKPSEVVSLSAFYKYFQNPIEAYFVPGAGSGGAKTFTYDNAKSSFAYGTELDVKKSLADISSNSFISNLSLIFNASLIQSEVQLGARAVGQSDKRPLQGQSSYIINGGVYYNNYDSRLQVSLLYNVVGKRIFIVGYEGYPDIYEMPRNQIDLTVSKEIGKYLQLKAGFLDLLNQGVILLQDGNQDKKFEKKGDQLVQQYKPGTVFSLGLSIRLTKD
jgi:outer membrane receptor protein involved in Fe transport